jgi:hypothetical protein
VVAATDDDCKRAIVFTAGQTSKIVTPHNLCVSRVAWLPHQDAFIFAAMERGTSAIKCYLQSLSDGTMRAFSDGYICVLTSPDGKYVLAHKGSSYFKIAIDGSEPPLALKLNPDYRPLRWTAPNAIVMIRDTNPFALATFNPDSGLVSQTTVKRPPGLESLTVARLSADGRVLAYSGYRLFSEMHVVGGLR